MTLFHASRVTKRLSAEKLLIMKFNPSAASASREERPAPPAFFLHLATIGDHDRADEWDEDGVSRVVFILCLHSQLRNGKLKYVYSIRAGDRLSCPNYMAVSVVAVTHRIVFQDICCRNWTSILSAGYNQDRSGLYLERI